MEAAIDANAPLNYAEFHIFPSQNRYEAYVSYMNKKERVTSGLLEHLLLHSAELKAMNSERSNAKYKLSPPDDSHDVKWFTKSTLIRFLHIIGSANILDITNSLRNEISQLEEARSFHLSLYAKGIEYQLQSGESDGNYSNGSGSTPRTEGSDSSKNELLRAMDLRLTALGGELTNAFDQAAGSRYSVEEMTDIEKFSQHLGSGDLSDSLRKYIEVRQGTEAVENSSSKQVSESDGVGSKVGNNNTTKSLSSETQVRYGVSPAKVAQVERQSSTESDESSFSSEEEQPSAERSRTLIRSASPRRSASPMRRIQIGRSGSRRSTAITIKSLNHFPARERSTLPKDPAANDSDEEGSEQAPKKPENNVRRMSVQDAINLFESKQRDQIVDIQKARSLLSASIGANKSVLRRWSSGMGEDSSHCPQESFAEDAVTEQNSAESREIENNSPESEAGPGVASQVYPIEPCGADAKIDSPEKGACSPVVMQEEILPTESTDVGDKLTASAEWSRQKEAELNELLTKMMETKPVKSRTVVPASSKRQSLPSEHRGNFYDQYKERRDEKLRGEAARKKTEKDKQLKAMQQIFDAKKSQLTSGNASDAGKKHTMKKMQKPQKSVAQPAIPKTESPRLGVVKKAPPRASSVPATRKSWPSAPSPRAPEPSPAKARAASSTGATPTRRRSQPTPSVSRPSPKEETSQTRAKTVNSNKNDSKKSLRTATENQQQSVTKPRKTPKSKVITAPEDLASATKPSLYSKVTKKSSVVPLESKTSLRRGSGTINSASSVVKKKKSSTQPQEPSRKPEDLTLDEESLTVSSSDVVIQNEQRETGECKIHTGMESETAMRSPKKYEDKEGFSQVDPPTEDGMDKVIEPELKAEAEEESTISPSAWVEMEEHEDDPVTSGATASQMVGSPAYIAPVEASSPRVRNSLSQMLLEESTESDVIAWGNAENPPPMVYQKDAPKGLKRLLKFARKSKNDANSTGWSSPSVFSEGEDDTEDSKFVNKRNAENLLRKATLHSKNNSHQKVSNDYEHPAQANISKFSAQSLSQQLQDGHVSAPMITTKATRSFFSLSAFKGSK
ncbi:titin homolog [Sesamum indicum]|uniref:Titin homolog n=1 Tax=Sesamum indicum TaxID=4182 RepID=A0A6I9T031_SESIN|nr:titin homolog [Sesamum indicum]XP_011076556.1 titin homolog [Sesamum indicum]XP_011076557.1 titin homolog [Sesamum indicum]